MHKENKETIPGRVLFYYDTVFDKLEQHGISVNANERFYEWFLVYDFESMLVPNNSQSSVNLQYTEQHVPISLSVCSNIDDHTEPRCIVKSNVDSLVEKMLDYMLTIARKAAELTKEKFSDVFAALDDLVLTREFVMTCSRGWGWWRNSGNDKWR